MVEIAKNTRENLLARLQKRSLGVTGMQKNGVCDQKIGTVAREIDKTLFPSSLDKVNLLTILKAFGRLISLHS